MTWRCRASRTPVTTTRARTALPPPGCWAWAGISRDLTDALVERAATVRTGGRDDTDAYFGPLNNPAQLARVQGFLERAPDHASIATGGHRVGGRGFCFAPTVVTGLLQDDEMIQDEVFGPVITVQRLQHRGRGPALGERSEVRAGRERLDP